MKITRNVGVARGTGRPKSMGYISKATPTASISNPTVTYSGSAQAAAILTNAVGGISDRLRPGCLVVLEDHINLQGINPLTGPNDPRFGTRFVDLTTAYNKDYMQMALREGGRIHLSILTGVYAALPGPNYETPAEIRFLRTIGAQRMPLLVKKELNHAAGFEIVGEFPAFFVEGHRITVSQFARPAIPTLQVKMRPQTVKENEIVQPPLVVFAEALELLAKTFRRRR